MFLFLMPKNRCRSLFEFDPLEGPLNKKASYLIKVRGFFCALAWRDSNPRQPEVGVGWARESERPNPEPQGSVPVGTPRKRGEGSG